MKKSVLLVLCFFWGSLAWGSELPFKSDFQISPVALTTEEAIQLDPTELNPQSALWILEREVKLKNLHIIQIKSSLFGVATDGLDARARGWVRARGYGFAKSINDFPCTQASQNQSFSTHEGAEIAVQTAYHFWDALLDQERVKLEFELNRFSADSSQDALDGAQKLFYLWYTEFNKLYLAKVKTYAREKEWADYEKQAALGKLCQSRKKSQATAENLLGNHLPLEAIPEGPMAKLPLVRAPALRWNGLYTIRVNFKYGDKKLVGQFLLNSGAPKTIFSPDWLNAQGVPPAWIEERKTPLEKLKGYLPPIAQGDPNPPLVRTALLAAGEDLDLDGQVMPIHEVMIARTDFFEPPATSASCCDGVLGADFFRKYAVEFIPNRPAEHLPRVNLPIQAPLKSAEVDLWARDNYRFEGATPVSVWLDEDQTTLSLCQVGKKTVRLKWLTSEKEASRAPGLSGGSFSLTCKAADNIGVSLGTIPIRGEGSAWSLGMEFIGKEGTVWDLSHGRIWLSPKFISQALSANTSGLELRFKLEQGDRVLRVVSVTKMIAPSGLRVGDRVEQLNNWDTGDLDQWEVEQLLLGREGKTISVKWNHAGQKKTGSFNLATK